MKPRDAWFHLAVLGGSTAAAVYFANIWIFAVGFLLFCHMPSDVLSRRR